MKIAIIGGGIGGLSLAYYLSKNPKNKVCLYEKNKELGGLLGLLEINGVGLEGYYHHLFKSDKYILDLIKELGLEDKLLFLPSKIGVYYQSKIYPFSSPFDLLRFSPLSFFDRLRCGLTVLYLQRMISWSNWRKYQDIPAGGWLRKFSGQRVWEVVWKPLLYGKFGKEADKISLAWFWHRFYVRGKSRGRFGTEEELLYLKGGFKILVTTLLQRMVENGGVVKTGVSIETCKGTTLIGNNLGRVVPLKESFDKVIFTTPIPVFLKLVEGLPKDYLIKLKKIKYRAALCLVLLLKNQLMKKIYWLNIHDLAMPLLSVVEQTNFIAKKYYGGENIVYVGNYLSWEDPLLKMEEEKLVEVVSSELQKINPKFKKDWLKKYWVFKDLYAQPVVTVDYHKFITNHKTPIKNLYLMTMAQIYPEDRGINQAVRKAKRLADVIMKERY